MYKGSVLMTPPLFLALGFIYLFSVGGLTGLLLGAAGPDVMVHDTHFVVSHFHFTMLGGTGYAFFAALHFWWPKMFGIMYNMKRAYIGAILTTVGFIFHFIPMMILGLMGMPRRYYDYLPQYATGNFLAGFGAFLLVIGIVVMFVNLLVSFRKREKASADPWGGSTLEWSIPSPPPLQNFIGSPEVKSYPYDFSQVHTKTPDK